MNVQSDNVVTWADKSGLGNNATNSANFPKTNLTTSISQFAYGGQETVDFFGTNWLNVDLTPLTGFEGYTIFIVDVVREIPSATYFMGSLFNGVDASLHFGYRDADSFTLAQYADDLNWDAPAPFAFGTPRLWTMRLDAGATQTIYLNGVQRSSRARLWEHQAYCCKASSDRVLAAAIAAIWLKSSFMNAGWMTPSGRRWRNI
ncbi:MAG: hypothetical protein QM813_24570 [Verrucomicrobiota bacterium]